mgnify:CR=1 FL=1
MIIITDGKLFSAEEGKLLPIESGILKKYINVARESARRNEWKYSGDGAKFTGTYVPHSDADSAVEAISSRVTDVDFLSDGTMLYSLYINGSAGIYAKPPDGGEEGIFISDNEYRYRDIAVNGERVLVTAEAAGECHIGMIEAGSRVCDFLTEGSSRESSPSWSKIYPDCFYYASAGLEEQTVNEENSRSSYDDMSVADMMKAMKNNPSAVKRRQGPSGIFRMNMSSYEIDELLIDDRYNYTCPTEDDDGGLWFIRYPYRYDAGDKKKLSTVLKDIVLFPVRLFGGILGFFDFFTMKYSGKTLNSSAGAAKSKSESQRFVLGNLIDAERELKRNSEHGEEYPGYVPREYELCRMNNGKTDVMARGICAYALRGGDVYCSNGSYVLKLGDGKPEKICKADNVTAICLKNGER